jgi:hypothetical protein
VNETLLYTGVGCILAAIVGGGFKGLGIVVPLIATLRRQVMLAVSGLVLVGFAQPQSFWRQFQTDVRSELSAGLEKYDQGMHREALEHFRKAALAGDPEAQYHYGEMLFHGEGILNDEKTGMDWVRRSAENGFLLGQKSLAGHLQLSNQLGEANAWAKRSAAQGDPEGVFLVLVTGEKPTSVGILKNQLVPAAEKGVAPAQYALAIVMANEFKDDPTRLPDVQHWLGRAATQGLQAALCGNAVTLNALRERRQQLQVQPMPGELENVLFNALLCQRDYPYDVEGWTKPEQIQHIEGIRRNVEALLPYDTRLRLREQAQAWKPKAEGKVRHGHIDYRSK